MWASLRYLYTNKIIRGVQFWQKKAWMFMGNCRNHLLLVTSNGGCSTLLASVHAVIWCGCIQTHIHDLYTALHGSDQFSGEIVVDRSFVIITNMTLSLMTNIELVHFLHRSLFTAGGLPHPIVIPPLQQTGLQMWLCERCPPDNWLVNYAVRWLTESVTGVEPIRSRLLYC